MWDLREVHACFDGDGWVWNESFHHKNVFVGENEDPKKSFGRNVSCSSFRII